MWFGLARPARYVRKPSVEKAPFALFKTVPRDRGEKT